MLSGFVISIQVRHSWQIKTGGEKQENTGIRPGSRDTGRLAEAAGVVDPEAWRRCGSEEWKNTSGRPATAILYINI